MRSMSNPSFISQLLKIRLTLPETQVAYHWPEEARARAPCPRCRPYIGICGADREGAGWPIRRRSTRSAAVPPQPHAPEPGRDERHGSRQQHRKHQSRGFQRAAEGAGGDGGDEGEGDAEGEEPADVQRVDVDGIAASLKDV